MRPDEEPLGIGEDDRDGLPVSRRSVFRVLKFLFLVAGFALALPAAFGKADTAAVVLAGLACFCVLVALLLQAEGGC